MDEFTGDATGEEYGYTAARYGKHYMVSDLLPNSEMGMASPVSGDAIARELHRQKTSRGYY